MDAAFRRALKSIAERCDSMIAKAVQRVERRIGNMIAVGVIESVNAGTKFQTLKATALEGDTDDEIVHFEPGGLVHVASAGAEGLTLSVGGKGANRAAVCVSNRSSRPAGVGAGETGLYTGGALGGLRILCKADGSIEITPAVGQKVVIKGELECEGEISAMTLTPATKVSLSTHVHPGPFPVGSPTPGS